jgi:hypothetical protein
MWRRGSSGTGGGSSVSVRALVSMLLLKEAVHVGAAVCYDCAETKQHSQPCLPLTYKTTKWCDVRVNDDDGGDFANVVIKGTYAAAAAAATNYNHISTITTDTTNSTNITSIPAPSTRLFQSCAAPPARTSAATLTAVRSSVSCCS